MDYKIKRTGRTLAAEGAVLAFYKDDMVLKDGSTAVWDFVHHKKGGGAAVVPVLPDGQILLVRQYRSSVEREMLELPAGAKDFENEDPQAAAARELLEETGYEAGKMTFLTRVKSAPAWCDEETTVFLAEELVKKSGQHLDAAEEIRFEAHPLGELLDLIFSGKMEDAKTVAGITAYAALRSRG